MSYFHSEISIPSNTNKKLRLDAHDSMERDYTFTFPAQTGENNSIMIIGEDQTASWTKDISINDISAVNFDISYVNAKFIDVSAMHANNINVASSVSAMFVSASVYVHAENVNATSVTAANVNATGDVTAANVNATGDVTGNSISLNTDNSVISFGANSDITLTHVADTGLTLKNTNIDDNSTVVLTLQNGKIFMQADDVIGAINFQPSGAILVAAGIEAVAGAPPESTESTRLSFKTAGSNETATEKAYINSKGSFVIRQQTEDYRSGLTLIPFGSYDNWTIFNLGNLNFSKDGTNMVYIKSSGGIGIRSQHTGNTGGITLEQITGSQWKTWYIFVDGNLNFNYDGNAKGFLNKDRSNSQMNFTGQHRSIMNTNISESFVGLIVSSTGKFVNTDNSLEVTINESLPVCVITTSDNDKKVFGVLSDKEDGENTRNYSSGNWVSVYNKQNNNEQRVFINSVGEGAIWISNKNGILENGDYISSSTVPGYGAKQADDLLHNYTVAKITCDCDFSTTKIVKQKLKVISTTDTSGNTITEIDYDANGDVQYEDDLDKNGNQQMVYPLETRFLEENGSQITEEQYTDKLANGENVYIACFVGCTYHCG